MRPPTWNEPMPRSTMSSFANAGSATLMAIAIKAKAHRLLPGFCWVIVADLSTHRHCGQRTTVCRARGPCPVHAADLRVRSNATRAHGGLLGNRCCGNFVVAKGPIAGKEYCRRSFPGFGTMTGMLRILTTQRAACSDLRGPRARFAGRDRLSRRRRPRSASGISRTSRMCRRWSRATSSGRARAGSSERLGPGVKIEWYVYNAGPSAMEAIFAKSLDLTYVGPNPGAQRLCALARRGDARSSPAR